MESKEQTNKTPAMEKLSDLLWIDMFGIACNLFRIYVFQVVWNLHITKILEVPPIKFIGAFILAVVIRYLVIGDIDKNVNISKRVSLLMTGVYWDTRTKDNVFMLIGSLVVYATSYAINYYGLLL